MPRKVSFDEFLERSKILHGEKYNYSKVFFKTVTDKIEIICPIHGSFWQEATSHLRGYAYKHCNSGVKRKGQSTFLKQAKKKFGNKFDYSKTQVERFQDPITIRCKKHGEFVSTPTKHLSTDYGCPSCAAEQIARKQSLTQEEFINRSNILHNNKYDYSLVEYISRRHPIKIICPEHGIFITTPEVHLKGCNCKVCSQSGWDRTSWRNQDKNNVNSNPTVYIIRCFNEEESFIKIGRTLRSIKDRFLRPSVMPYKYELIAQFFGSSDEMFNLEIKLHRMNKDFRYIPKIKFPGSRECFTKYIT